VRKIETRERNPRDSPSPRNQNKKRGRKRKGYMKKIKRWPMS
jgi:hypothetical protein